VCEGKKSVRLSLKKFSVFIIIKFFSSAFVKREHEIAAVHEATSKKVFFRLQRVHLNGDKKPHDNFDCINIIYLFHGISGYKNNNTDMTEVDYKSVEIYQPSRNYAGLRTGNCTFSLTIKLAILLVSEKFNCSQFNFIILFWRSGASWMISILKTQLK